jgi:murein DD-endopeptidase MepM/ murein hydrolase activator NlpD
MAGCSADVMRLDSPASLSFNDSGSSMSRPQASMSRSGAGAGSLATPVGEAYAPPQPSGGSGARMAALPEPSPAPSYAPQTVAPVGRAPRATSAPSPVAATAVEKGEAVVIKQGDTLFGLSKRHHVSVAELMSVNGLTSPALKPGQTLYLPAGRSAGKKPLTRPTDAASAVAAAAPAASALAPPTAAQLAKYDGSYTVKKGDSLYGLAIQMKVPFAELQQVNGIADVRKVRPGAVLKVPSSALATLPSGAQPSVATATVEPAIKVPPAAVAKEVQATVQTTTRPVLLNGDKSVAAVEPAQSDAGTSGAGGAAPTTPVEKGPQVAAAGQAGTAVAGKLRWPAKGKVIGSFGPRPDGTHNDGVNLSVPLGTDVHAAEGGTIAYAGSELKGYGNLILVRHDNGWITAYAHNEELLAKRGDKVKRGQVIAKAGKSGQVDAPQVHFELRQGSKPVDPTPFMEKL